MTAVHQVFTIRSFRNAKDRDFLRALHIYDANTHLQAKTDSREIASWLDRGASHPHGKFFVCGLYVSADLVGFVEFIHLKKERLIHVDYFIIQPERRTAGAFHIFAEQMLNFFEEEDLEWDFITAEIAELEVVDGLSRHAQRLIRLFRQVGFSEVLAEYEQPLLGVEHKDTKIKATLLLRPRVAMQTISPSRYLGLVSAIYRKHYAEWYSIYPETLEAYRAHIEKLIHALENQVSDKKEIPLRGPEYEFVDPTSSSGPPMRDALFYLVKIALSAVAVATFHIVLRNKADSSLAWIFGISASAFALLVVTISLADKKRFEAFKLLISLVSKFFDR